MRRPWLLLVLAGLACAGPAQAQDKLVFAVDVIRHGDRTPLDDIPAAPHAWTEGLGQLTATGMRQEYQLGARLRSEYVARYRLLPSTYVAAALYVRSSDIDRTLMSAQAFLMGLYPLGTGPAALPGAAQPIPIHAVAQHEESLLFPDSEFYHYNDLLARYVFSTPQWQAQSDKLRPQFAHWSRATGRAITDLYQLKSLGDTLNIDQLYHVPLPPGLSQEDAQAIIDAGRWAFVAGFKPTEIGKVTGKELLQTIAADMKKAAQGPTALRYVLFSAHDSTLLSEMSALGAPLDSVPPYASRLNFSLFDAGQQGVYVKVTYNDQPVSIPACGGVSCSLPQFAVLAGL